MTDTVKENAKARIDLANEVFPLLLEFFMQRKIDPGDAVCVCSLLISAVLSDQANNQEHLDEGIEIIAELIESRAYGFFRIREMQ